MLLARKEGVTLEMKQSIDLFPLRRSESGSRADTARRAIPKSPESDTKGSILSRIFSCRDSCTPFRLSLAAAVSSPSPFDLELSRTPSLHQITSCLPRIIASYRKSQGNGLGQRQKDANTFTMSSSSSPSRDPATTSPSSSPRSSSVDASTTPRATPMCGQGSLAFPLPIPIPYAGGSIGSSALGFTIPATTPSRLSASRPILPTTSTSSPPSPPSPPVAGPSTASPVPEKQDGPALLSTLGASDGESVLCVCVDDGEDGGLGTNGQAREARVYAGSQGGAIHVSLSTCHCGAGLRISSPVGVKREWRNASVSRAGGEPDAGTTRRDGAPDLLHRCVYYTILPADLALLPYISQVWDLRTHSLRARLTGHTGAVLALQLVPERDWLISASGGLHLPL